MSEAVCPICCDDDAEEEALHTLECGHAFHTACILQWFRQGAPTCPLCRDTDDDHHLTPLDTMARCTLLRQRARRKDAPTCLKRLVRRLRDAEEDLRAAGKELRVFETEHRSVIRDRRKRLVGKWRKWRRVRQLKRQVGVYTHPDVSMPLVTRRNRFHGGATIV